MTSWRSAVRVSYIPPIFYTVDKDKALSLTALRQCAARLVAAALCRLYPEALLIKCEATHSGFLTEFFLQQPVTSDIFPLLQEHLRVIVTEKTPLRTHTMVRDNASELFNHRRQVLKPEFLPQKPLIDILQIGDFYDECPLPHPSEVQELKNLELLDLQKVMAAKDLEAYRITGTIFHDKGELKDYLKQRKKLNDHQKICIDKKLFYKDDTLSDGEWVAEPRGAALVKAFRKLWSHFCHEDGIEQIMTPGLQSRYFLKDFGFPGQDEWTVPATCAPAHLSYMMRKQSPRRVGEFCRVYQNVDDFLLEGLLRTRGYWTDQEHMLCADSQAVEELISSLQFIGKSNKMLSIEGEWVLQTYGKVPKKKLKPWNLAQDLLREAFKQSRISDKDLDENGDLGLETPAFVGPRLEFRFRDVQGRRWIGPYVGIWMAGPVDRKKQYPEMRESCVIQRSQFGSIERIIALLCEKGPLPHWLEGYR